MNGEHRSQTMSHTVTVRGANARMLQYALQHSGAGAANTARVVAVRGHCVVHNCCGRTGHGQMGAPESPLVMATRTGRSLYAQRTRIPPKYTVASERAVHGTPLLPEGITIAMQNQFTLRVTVGAQRRHRCMRRPWYQACRSLHAQRTRIPKTYTLRRRSGRCRALRCRPNI